MLCADKNYQGIDDVIQNIIDLVEADFTPAYPNANLWSNTYNVEITSIVSAKVPLANGSRTPIIRLKQQMCVFNINL